eukprot:jgi/Mesvir1/6756/Mv16717-RA.1
MGDQDIMAALCALRDKHCEASVSRSPAGSLSATGKGKDAVSSGDGAELPSFHTYVREFGLFCSQDDGNSRVCEPQVAADGRISCACSSCSRWKAFCGGSPPPPGDPTALTWGARRYEVLTEEFVEMLVDYLLSQARVYGLNTLRVLEVGAGSGALADHIRRMSRLKRVTSPCLRSLTSHPTPARTCDQRGPGAGHPCPSPRGGAHAEPARMPQIEVVAVDNNALGLADDTEYCATNHGPEARTNRLDIVDRPEVLPTRLGTVHGHSRVLLMDAIEAIRAFPSHVIICCWQPLGVDWTAAMRACPTLLEYILIGEKDDGICGHWGQPLRFGKPTPHKALVPSSVTGQHTGPRETGAEDGPGKKLEAEHARVQERSSLVTVEPSLEGPGLVEGTVASCQGGPVQCVPRSCQERARCVGCDPERRTGKSRPSQSLVVDTDGNRGDVPRKKRKGKGQVPPVVGRGGTKVYHGEMPPYLADGFVREDLTWFNPWQVCRTDERWSTRHHSHVVAFRRTAAAPEIAARDVGVADTA